MPPPDPPASPADPPAAPRKKPAKRPPRAGLVGPLFKWELVRLARRGQDARARFILAASLLVVLTLFTVFWFSDIPVLELFTSTAQALSIEDSAKFANSFALTFLIAQLSILSLLTPAYAAGGIAEEKEKKTFPFLLATDLTGREIVFGKFLGRLVFLLGVMLAGLPILSLTLLYGGVSVQFLLMAYFLTATTVTLLAALGVASACYAETFRGALFRSYGLAALHIWAGCGMHPVLSPIGILVILSRMLDPASFEEFLLVGLGYGGLQLLLALGTVWLAVRAVRNARAAPTRRPPPRPRRSDREPNRDRDRYRTSWRPGDPLDEARPAEVVMPRAELVAPKADVVVPVPEANGRPAAVATRATAKPAAPARDRDRGWDDDREDDRPRRRLRPRLPAEVANRPPVDPDDPFWWKERYVAPAKRDADDESIRGVMIAVGVVVGLTLGFFLLIAVLAVLASGGTRRSLAAAQGLLIIGGAAGMFTHLLMVGSAAAGAVCRERQRLTLESLLTIPVDRRRILWPKWLISLTRGWWWGAPATACVAVGLLCADPPVLAFPAVPYLAACAPFAASLGLWLSVRCRTVTRAVLWFLPAAGVMTLVPVFVWWGTDAGDAWVGLVVMGSFAVLVAAAAVAFWLLAWAGFENEGRE